MVLREGVVEPLVGLLNARLAADLEELDEEILHVLVGEELGGRDDVVLVAGLPVEVVHLAELLGVLSRRIYFIYPVSQSREQLTASAHNSQRTFLSRSPAIGKMNSPLADSAHASAS